MDFLKRAHRTGAIVMRRRYICKERESTSEVQCEVVEGKRQALKRPTCRRHERLADGKSHPVS